MGLGALATVGAKKPANLAIAVIDNERYGETGGSVPIPAPASTWRHCAAAGSRRQSPCGKWLNSRPRLRLLHKAEGPVLAGLRSRRPKIPCAPNWMVPCRSRGFGEALLGGHAAA